VSEYASRIDLSPLRYQCARASASTRTSSCSGLVEHLAAAALSILLSAITHAEVSSAGSGLEHEAGRSYWKLERGDCCRSLRRRGTSGGS
jgi:hypothetical protein